MNNLRFVTLTGAGEATTFTAMKTLSERFDFVEWGVLYNPERAGQDNRCPSLEWLERFAKKANTARMNIALHLCGKTIAALLDGIQNRTRSERPDDVKRILELASKFGRVQINTRAKLKHLEGYKKLVCELHRSENCTRVIFQWNEHNAPVCKDLRGEPGFEVLADASGGRGVSPEAWPQLSEWDAQRPGYAGGMGPDNIVEQIAALQSLTNGSPFWVDMEGKIRDDQDRFDLARCESVLSQVCELLKADRKSAMAQWGSGTRNVLTMPKLWLDWWVARATGRARRLSVPPLNASKVTYLDRQAGEFSSLAPSQDQHLAIRLLHEERIALVPGSGDQWDAWAEQTPKLRASNSDMLIAGLRAIVLKHFGDKVPKNAYWEDGLEG